MTPINFITTLSAKQHRTLRTWWHFSLVGFFGIVIGVVVLQSMQLYVLYKAVLEHRYMQEHARTVHSELEPYTVLKKEEEALRSQQTKIDHIYHSAERSGLLLTALHATDESAHIQSCKLDKKSFELIVQTANTESALNEIKRLRTVKQLHEIKLVSLARSRKDTSMIATIQGKIRKT